MEPYAARLLKLVLDKCEGAPVSELRFVSDMAPAFVDKDGPHFIDVGYLSTELVHELHQTCLTLAEEAVPNSDASATYTFFLRRLGRVQCKYQHRGNAASLVLAWDSDGAEMVAAIRPKKPPSLRAEAKPRRKRRGD